ncbi:MAG: hypothetical protein RLZZ297_712 [Chloroflexota bacterium]|jgi:four helix bundle protein
MHRQNIVRDLSYDFARHILQLYKQRAADREFRPLFTQLLRSGTSIASNIEEAIGSQSRADFTHKISIAYKEARETQYWLRLLTDEQVIAVPTGNALQGEVEAVVKLLYRIQATTRKNNEQ